jgi:hypothetical protein
MRLKDRRENVDCIADDVGHELFIGLVEPHIDLD